ncbi:MAG: hypothetical protein ACD_39C02062G0002 [uncultured bacterium]|nr:MAG: hypothetical protein ACD_39C02062G0002 [uncultured bacterium]
MKAVLHNPDKWRDRKHKTRKTAFMSNPEIFATQHLSISDEWLDRVAFLRWITIDIGAPALHERPESLGPIRLRPARLKDIELRALCYTHHGQPAL